MVSLQHLRTLHSVRSHGGIHAAAKALHLSPSAVSQQIKTLGSECGFPLVEPDGRGIRLTTRGSHIAKIGLQIAEIWEASLSGHRAAEKTSPTQRRCLKVGAFPSAMARCVLPAIKSCENMPFDLQLFEVTPHEARALTTAGVLDAAVCIQNTTDEQTPLHAVPLRHDPFLFVGPPVLASSVNRPGATQPLSGVPWVLPKEGSDSDKLITAHFARHEIRLRAAARTDDWGLAQEMALALNAMTLVPSSALISRSDLARSLEADGVAPPTRTVVLTTEAAASAAPWFTLLHQCFYQAYTRTTGVVYGT